MNSQHSFARAEPNTLLKQTFIEFSECMKIPLRLYKTDHHFIIQITRYERHIFDSEEETVNFMRDEIRAKKDSCGK